jgi:nicotinate dehydrogenase subunit B
VNAAAFNRRQFAAGLGAVVVAFSLGPELARGQERLPGGLQNNRRLDAWIRINADGGATVFTGKVELGQGVLTALAQIAAEELDLPLSRIEMISGDTGRTPDEGHTSGSVSIESSGTALRMATAEVRSILLDLAANRLGTSPSDLTVASGVIAAPDGRKIGYGELVAALDLKREATAKVRPKAASNYKVVGQAVQRLDIPAKVTGGAAYVQDIRLPGMLHGRAVRPPRYGAKLESFDEAATRAMPGIVAIVRDGSFLGVIAEREEQAIKARAALSEGAKWSGGTELPDPEREYDHLLSLRSVDTVASEKRASPAPSGARVVEATYRKPYLAHASMGPSCALAEFRDGRFTIWSHTQGQVAAGRTRRHSVHLRRGSRLLWPQRS